jgi:hypothetical protein
MASTSAAFSAREPCIFQLPAMIGRRITESSVEEQDAL